MLCVLEVKDVRRRCASVVYFTPLRIQNGTILNPWRRKKWPRAASRHRGSSYDASWRRFFFSFLERGEHTVSEYGPRYTPCWELGCLESILNIDEVRLLHMQDTSISHGVGNV